jgi:pseudo-rSAM protein
MKKNDLLNYIKTEPYFWLAIEPYVFIFKGKEEYILYNTFSHKSLTVSIQNIEVIDLLDTLLNIDNMYTTHIIQERLLKLEIFNFIFKLRKGFFGDIYPTSLIEQKPISIPPVLSVKNSIENITKDEELDKKETYLNFLHELTIYLNGECDKQCKYCNAYHKQFLFCTQTNTYFSKEEIDLLLLNIGETNISKINLVGGNILKYNNLHYLLSQIKLYNIGLYIYYKNVDFNIIKEISLYDNLFIYLLISITEIDNNELYELISQFVQINNLCFNFIITSEKDKNMIDTLVEHFSMQSYNILPFYDGNNIDFFKQMVFLSKEEILKTSLKIEDIFIRQSLNIYDYGKFIVNSDKNIYANLNFPSIGTTTIKMIDLVKKEVIQSSPWFRTRNTLDICKDCAYCFLCPSPSNYEMVIGKPNLCHVKP